MIPRYVLVQKFVELTGYSQQAIYTKINQGVWTEGNQFIRSPDRRVQIDMEAYERWVEEGRPAAEASNLSGTASGSGSPTTEPDEPSRSRRGRRKLTFDALPK